MFDQVRAMRALYENHRCSSLPLMIAITMTASSRRIAMTAFAER